MKARVSVKGAVGIVRLAGKVAIGSGDTELPGIVSDLLRSGCRLVVLDLGRVGYMDSGGLGAIVAGWRDADEQNARLVLLRPTGKVRNLLAVTGLSEVFEIYADEEAALASLSPSRP